ncbi:MAG: methylated-DNA-[protein]-cysteine S-methyltransferase [Pseudomonadota bacterium]|jgi:AraC family transcriptional regulator of adaptative response/methylated-DNA-[protein]-cysteine methyltransferase
MFQGSASMVQSEELVTRGADDVRWQAVRQRDATADGSFYYAVASTGVYCRPSCAARLPRRENVSFHRTTAEAEVAGFRACKRCKPEQPPAAERRAQQVADLCRFIDRSLEEAGVLPGLQELAEHAGLSPHHLHRAFKAVTGVTPRAYGAAQKAQRLRSELEANASVTAASYRAGFGSSSRLHSASQQRLGMTPSRYRAGGQEEQIEFSVGSCSLGALLVAATERGLCAILLGEDAAELEQDLRRRFARAELRAGGAEFQQRVTQVIQFVEQPQLGLSLPLDLRGTAFQERVWQALQAIPAGVTQSYRQVAQALGTPQAVRAVASACGANPLAVAVPCHRVVRSDGGLSGYRWGIERKRALLEREQATTAEHSAARAVAEKHPRRR